MPCGNLSSEDLPLRSKVFRVRNHWCYNEDVAGGVCVCVCGVCVCVCASNGIEWHFEQVYACEIDAKKREWISEVTRDEDCLIYEDVLFPFNDSSTSVTLSHDACFTIIVCTAMYESH